MATIKPFRGVRAPRQFVEQLSARPYDVLSSEEARSEAEGNPMSLYHITRPEINFEPGTDEHDERVYDEAGRQYRLFRENGWLQQDAEECYYLYAETWRGKTQNGLVIAASADDYEKGVIRKHELTRRDKEDDRMRHVVATNANMGPAFFAYPSRPELRSIISDVKKAEPEYDFTTPDGVRHQLWVISEPGTILKITMQFDHIQRLYIADGHHRSAAAARVALERKAANPAHRGDEEYNYFLAVAFPDDELTVIDYNRVLFDTNGLNSKELLARLREDFEVECMGSDIYHPARPHEFALYLDDERWYRLTTKPEHIHDDDPIGCLDVKISSDLILDKIFDIKDLRGSKRIDFVGGIRGLEELKRRVDSGEAACALALYPVTMQQIFRVADTGNIMPPKATWFEPKLRSGIVIHELD